jgi:hypothetical protein
MGGLGEVGSLGVSDVSGMSVSDVAGTSENSGLGGVAGTSLGAAATAAAAEESGLIKAMTAVQNQIKKAIDNPVQTALGMVNPAYGLAFGIAKDAYSNYSRGVTGPSDDTQESTSVQSGPSQSPSGGGISTIQSYAPLYNPDTGNPTMDAYIRQLRVNLGLPV